MTDNKVNVVMKSDKYIVITETRIYQQSHHCIKTHWFLNPVSIRKSTHLWNHKCNRDMATSATKSLPLRLRYVYKLL